MTSRAPLPGPDRAAPADLTEAHRRLAGDETLQFTVTPAREPPVPPGWLRALVEAIGEVFAALAPVVQYLFWGLVAAAVAALVYFAVREGIRLRWKGRRGRVEVEGAEGHWRPTAAFARLLLDEADRLAAEGRYAEAAHHLLLYSIQDAEERRPRSIRPAYTSREIASLEILPPEARSAFAKIAAVVERSLFGGRTAGEADFRACRQAYEAFAFPEAWR